MKVLITGGCGFIGSALCRHGVRERGWSVVNVDALTYAASPEAVAMLADHPRYAFVRADIRDRAAMDAVMTAHDPDAVVHLAAESHVDRSIDGPEAFLQTNIIGAHVLLQAARAHLDRLSSERAARFRFHHVSTDEVFGSLDDPVEGPADGSGDAAQAGGARAFQASDAYRPNSPYAASKAASDHLARAWAMTYGLPVLLTNCGNNYGPYQFPEKLIPLMILKALSGETLPVYGDGGQARDWIHVEDHARALALVLEAGMDGRTPTLGAGGDPILIGARAVRRNLDVVRSLCAILDARRPDSAPHDRLIGFVADRPGHDRRYAVDPSAVEALGFAPSFPFEEGLARTVDWYLDHEPWWRAIKSGRYGGERLGAVAPASLA